MPSKCATKWARKRSRPGQKWASMVMAMPSEAQFLTDLREALNHLYDPDYLRRCPLASLLGVAGRFDTPAQLQRVLTDAIKALQPEAGATSAPRGKHSYQLLAYRYLEQYSQQEVADQLDVSVRQLRREQNAALGELAYHLWRKLDLAERLAGEEDAASGGSRRTGESAPAARQAVESRAEAEAELAWLEDIPLEGPADLPEELAAVAALMRPVATQHAARLEVSAPAGLPGLAVHPVALRQMLVALLGVAIHRGGAVIVSARARGWATELSVRTAEPQTPARPMGDDEQAKLDLASRLAALCRGKLCVPAGEAHLQATLTLPTYEQLPVLAIDDNADTLQLLQRYAAGSRYRMVVLRDPLQAFAVTEKVAPQVILLDVMMPQLDGWEMVGRLQQHPITAGIPIVVCSILAEDELALSLGAAAFLRKPLTRQALLRVLEEQTALLAAGRVG
jgi:CheY-like chemotaxis protein